MIFHDLIFSTQRQNQLLRHLCFWVLWFLFFELTYFLPYYWYQGWHTSKLPAPVTESGYLSFGALVFVNSIIALSVQAFFTYTLLYVLLPRYLLKNKAVFFAIACIVLLFACVILFYLEFKYSNPIVRELFNRPPKIWTHQELLSCTTDMVFFNCPTVGGIAVGFKLLKRWWLKQIEATQLTTAIADAELRLLKAQVHPHFLFNTLNNLYWFIMNASPQAPEMVKKLSGMLRYVIYECNQPLVSVENELVMIQDYIALEKVRYGEELDLTIEISGNVSNKVIAPLLLIPFVENCFKHGTSKMLSKPWVNLRIIFENETLYFMVSNSKPLEYSSVVHKNGIGLLNVQRRLRLLYPDRHTVTMTEEAGHFTVVLEIQLQATNSSKRDIQKQKGRSHELA